MTTLAEKLGGITEQKPQTLHQRLSGAQSTLAGSQSRMDQLHQKALQQMADAQAQTAPLKIAQETAKGTVNTVLGGAVKAARSGVTAIGEMFGAKTNYQDTYTDFAGNTQKTLQGEVFAGEKTPLQGTGEFALEASSVIPIGKGASLLKEVAGPTVSKMVGAVTEPVAKLASKAVSPITNFLIKRAEKKALQSTFDAIAPKLTPTEVREGRKAGDFSISTTMMKGAKPNYSTNERFVKTAGAVKNLVKGKSASADYDSVEGALGSEAKNLVKRVRELGKQMPVADTTDLLYRLDSKIDEAVGATDLISLRGTPFEQQVVPLKQALLNLVKKHGSTPEGLLASRKEFDQLVRKTWPNLYESDHAPMKNAVTTLRRVVNDFVEESLPQGSGFKESLDLQRMYYEAMDSIATKIPDEVRKGGLPKQLLNNPFVKAGIGGAIGAGVVGGGINALKSD